MYGLRLTLRASAALTMRVLPSGILDIISYPFVPPTTLSGWLRRVWMLAEGLDLPETTASKDAPFYVLPPSVVSLGAYPKKPSYIHKTKRKGTKHFRDTSFTRLIFDKKTAPLFQLHTWEYLTTDQLEGFVVSKDKKPLERLHAALQEHDEALPWGCKLGKEGFAYVHDVSKVQVLEAREDTLAPTTLLSINTVVSQSDHLDFAIHNIYRFAWQKDASDEDLQTPSPVQGYDILPLALASHGNVNTSWWCGEDMHFPQGLETTLGVAHD